MTERALGFGSAASAYERFRPGYPDELADEVLAYAGRPLCAALEIGAGTGKATRVFVARGIAVTATEPDPAMLGELRRQLPAAATVQAAFEDLPLTAAYDLVFAAAALHWTRPDRRWPRVAAMLTPGGVFASFGGPMHLSDPDVEKAVHAARSEFHADDDVPSPDGTPADSPMQWPGTELIRSGRFVDVRQSTIERRVTISAGDYVGHLSTISAYLELPSPVRRHVLDRIHRVLPDRVTLVADITVHLARLGRAGRRWRRRTRGTYSGGESSPAAAVRRSIGNGHHGEEPRTTTMSFARTLRKIQCYLPDKYYGESPPRSISAAEILDRHVARQPSISAVEVVASGRPCSPGRPGRGDTSEVAPTAAVSGQPETVRRTPPTGGSAASTVRRVETRSSSPVAADESRPGDLRPSPVRGRLYSRIADAAEPR